MVKSVFKYLSMSKIDSTGRFAYGLWTINNYPFLEKAL